MTATMTAGRRLRTNLIVVLNRPQIGVQQTRKIKDHYPQVRGLILDMDGVIWQDSPQWRSATDIRGY